MYIENKILTIVSRKSKLALQQAHIVKNLLLEHHPALDIDIIGISTSGDEILDKSLQKIGGKGLFVKELENFLLQDKADIAVHSMKDVPAELPEGLGIGAILTRADPRDVFVSINYRSVLDLPAGSVVGTSSLRRQAQVLAVRPDLKIVPLRGNVETRLQKLQAGEYAAIILAAAGLERLGLDEWLQYPLTIDQMLPAVGQGAIGIEYRMSNTAIQPFLLPLNDPLTAACVTAERAMNALLNGGCQAPIAGLASIVHESLVLRGLVAQPDGTKFYRSQQSGPINAAEHIGNQVARELLGYGAGAVIAALKEY